MLLPRTKNALFILVLVSGTITAACGGAQTGSPGMPPPTAKSANCPEPGARVSYKKLVSLASDYVGCDIEVEVEVFAAGWGNQTCLNAPAAGKVQFQFIEPGGQAENNALAGAGGFLGLIVKSASDPVLNANAGDRLILRGGMFYQAYGGAMEGQGSACFVATSAEAAK